MLSEHATRKLTPPQPNPAQLTAHNNTLLTDFVNNQHLIFVHTQ